jgi:DDE_Tnp_1-associated/Transposase DDE domain
MKHLLRKAVPVAPASPPGSLAAALEQVPDPRRPYGWRPAHGPLPLVGLLQLTVAATLCGARSLYAIAQWGEDRRQDDPGLLEALGLPPGRRPCVATLHRVFKRLDVATFEAVLGTWLQQTGVAPTDPIAVDGKTLRGIHGEAIPGVHLVGAYAHAAGAILAQLRTTGKGQELAAAKAVLAEVPLAGRLVTTDALLTQREVAQQVVDRGGAYLLPVKDNQPSLHADLAAAFSPLAADRA